MRVRIFISAAGAELSRAAAVAPELRNLDRQQTSSTAVLATTDPNLLNYGSPAVASGRATCCGPAIQRMGSVSASTAVGDVRCRSRFAELSITPPQ